jgi:hypothetical protein
LQRRTRKVCARALGPRHYLYHAGHLQPHTSWHGGCDRRSDGRGLRLNLGCSTVAVNEVPNELGTSLFIFQVFYVLPAKQGESGEGGIRTHETALRRLRDFQSRSFGQLGHLSGKRIRKSLSKIIPGTPRRRSSASALGGITGVDPVLPAALALVDVLHRGDDDQVLARSGVVPSLPVLPPAVTSRSHRKTSLSEKMPSSSVPPSA